MQNYKDIIAGVINRYQEVDVNNAQSLIDELTQYQSHWDDCKTYEDFYHTYISIFYILGLANAILGRYQESLNLLLPALEEYYSLSEYGYNIKADFYQLLGYNYCHLEQESEARIAYNKMAYNHFKDLNRKRYAIDLYSFRTPREYSINDIKNNTLSFSSLSSFNDPVDSAFFKIEEAKRKDLTDKTEEMASRLISEAYANFRVRSLVSNINLFKLVDMHSTEKEYLNNIPEYKSALMWGYYTQNHEGFCIKYNFQERITSHDAVEEVMLAQMDYVESMPYTTDLTFQKCFLTKSIDWSHEREKRLLYYNPDNIEEYPTVTIPKEAIKAIYFGVKCSDETKMKIKKAISDKPHVELFQMQISENNVYDLEAVRI